MSTPDTVVLDVDGTLVDTVYHHTMAWARAFAEQGLDVPVWRMHRAIGMGGDKIVAHLTDDATEERYGDRLRELHGRYFSEVIEQVAALPGASRLVTALLERGVKVALASSGEGDQTRQLLSEVEGVDRVDAFVTGSDVEQTKPSPDLVQVAVEKAGGRTPVVVGDSVWDVTIAHEQGWPAVGLLCGGFGEGELTEAGAGLVVASPGDLADRLDEVLGAQARR